MCVKFIPYQLVIRVGAANKAAQPASRFMVSPWLTVTRDRLVVIAEVMVSRIGQPDTVSHTATRAFLLTDTAASAIYTITLALSLPDALPI